MAPLELREPGSVAGTRRDPGVDRTVPEGTRANARAGAIAARDGDKRETGEVSVGRAARRVGRRGDGVGSRVFDRVSDRRKSGTAIVHVERRGSSRVRG